MKTGAWTHRKTKRLMRILGVPRYTAVGLVEAVLMLVQRLDGDARIDGDLSHLTAQDIADEIEWDGCADELVSAMVESGWLERSETGLFVHNWDKHRPVWVSRLDKRRRSSADRSGERSADCSAECSAEALENGLQKDHRAVNDRSELGIGIGLGSESLSSGGSPEGGAPGTGGEAAAPLPGKTPENGDMPPGAAEGVLSGSVLRWAVAPLPRLAGREGALSRLRETLEKTGETAADVRRGCELYAASDHGRGECPFGVRRFVDECMWRDDRATWSNGKPAPDLSNVDFGG